MYVLKFGGSSVANAGRIKNVGEILRQKWYADEQLAVVFSALGGVTDMLLNMSSMASKADLSYQNIFKDYKAKHLNTVKELVSDDALAAVITKLNENHKTLKQLLKGVFLVRESSKRTTDYILSFGERNSCLIISAYLNDLGLPAEYTDARKMIKTNKDFGAAKVYFDQTFPLISQSLHDSVKIPVITGFIASDIGGLTTTLGRGGSDYTAALIASALDADILEIWTDVDGVLTSDPRKVKEAYTIKNLSYNEAMELSHFGAKVIYPPTIQPALNKNIPIYIKNTFNPDFEGTLISREIVKEEAARIKGMSSISDVVLLTLQGSGMLGVPGTAARLFGALARAKINIIMITQGSSEHSICFAVQNLSIHKSIEVIEEEFSYEIQNRFIDPVVIQRELCLIAIVGEKMKSMPGVAGRLFQSLGRNGVNVVAIAQGSSELNISFAIHSKDENKALNLIHESFFLSGSKAVNVFLIGLGLIGSTLLKQIRQQQKGLLKNRHLKINIAGIANSKKMYFKRNGIHLNDWKSLLNDSGEKSHIETFVEKMKVMNLPNSVFVDITADVNIPKYYLDILKSNISISTPNKIAASSSYSVYENLKKTALRRNVHFLYETNVGAGLPIISTLHNLILSGDKILKIDAVLSGSLSYIFNHFHSRLSFREVVQQAIDLGLTEPDPREDLSGKDVMRKIVILSRDAGYKIDVEDVHIQKILPEECENVPDVDSFLKTLDRHNSFFKGLIEKAESTGKVLRFMATLEDGLASVKLKEIDKDSPFYSLHDSDNMIAFTTERYKERPLIVKGPGAGGQVTAAGVFAEIISIGSVNYFGYN